MLRFVKKIRMKCRTVGGGVQNENVIVVVVAESFRIPLLGEVASNFGGLKTSATFTSSLKVHPTHCSLSALEK
jgi:hypothetical protein